VDLPGPRATGGTREFGNMGHVDGMQAPPAVPAIQHRRGAPDAPALTGAPRTSASLSRRNPFAWIVLGGALLWSAATNSLAVLIDINRGWQDHWASELTYLEVTWLPYFGGITTHLRLLREWLLDGRGGVDLYLAYAGAGGRMLLVALLVAAIACAAAAWLVAGDTAGRERLAVVDDAAEVGEERATPARRRASGDDRGRGAAGDGVAGVTIR
jgi:hypothetical protein